VPSSNHTQVGGGIREGIPALEVVGKGYRAAHIVENILFVGNDLLEALAS
jgi:hypothetical protein